MCPGLKLIRHMWEASLPDMGLNKSMRHEPKWTIPANWGPRQETLPQLPLPCQTLAIHPSYDNHQNQTQRH